MSKLAARALVVSLSAVLVSCSGGSSSPPPPAATYQIGGSVSGLAGSGLVLRSSLGDTLPISADGAFVFPTSAVAGTAYAVTVSVQPTSPSQECTVSSGAGTIGSADVASVSVTCTTLSFHVGGTVAGLLGTGLELQNGTDTVTVDPDSNPTTAFTFGQTVPSGGSFAASVKTQPSAPPQDCTVSGGSGTVGSGDVTSVVVNCTTLYTIGGSVSGLAGTLVLRNNDTEDVTVNVGDGGFAFATPLADGAAYAVLVKSNPTTPWQECVVDGGQGNVAAANVTTIAVTCTTKYLVSGTVSGALEPGLVLRNNGADDLEMDADGVFTFATRLATDDPYAVTVLADPPTQTCSVANDSGTIAYADVQDVAVTCTCATGLGDCDDDASNGCETDVMTSAANCGGCGTACPAIAHGTAGCSAGTCGVAACSPNFGDCNGAPADGCETDLRFNDAHCGACEIDCDTGVTGLTCQRQSGNDYACQ